MVDWRGATSCSLSTGWALSWSCCWCNSRSMMVDNQFIDDVMMMMMMVMMMMLIMMIMMMTTMPGECWGRASREGCRTAQGCSYQCQTGCQVKGIFQNFDVTLTATLAQVINLLFGQVHPEGLGGDGVEVWQAEEGQAEADVLLDLETNIWAEELKLKSEYCY